MTMSGPLHVGHFARDDVVRDVRVDRNGHPCLAGLHRGQEAEQAAPIVAFRKALAGHQAALPEHIGREQKAIGRHAIDLGVVRPPRQQRLENAGRRALAHRHAASHPDDVGHLRLRMPEERCGRPVEILGRRYIQVQEPRQRQVDLDDLVEIQGLVDPTELLELRRAQRERRVRPQPRPRVAVEVEIYGRIFRRLLWVHRCRSPWSIPQPPRAASSPGTD